MADFYTVTYDDGSVHASGGLPRPEDLPNPGQTLVVKECFSTLGARTYYPGDKLELLQRTKDAPHHRTSSLGNWLVRDRFTTSVWTNIEYAIATGRLAVMK